jgi:putative endonuclease
MNQSYVYMLSSKRNGTLYVGVTSDLIKRIYEHKHDFIDGFTKQYQVHMLVYYEVHNDILEAIKREKQIKKWNRQWKLRLVEELNPD